MDDIIDGLVTESTVVHVTTKAQLNGSEECIMIDSSLDEDCIDGIGEPVVKVSKRKVKHVHQEPVANDNGVHNDGSNASTSSMSSRSSDIGQDNSDLASLPPNEARETNDPEVRFENESTSASMRLSLSASEDEAEEPSLCLTNLFDETKPTQVPGQGDQEMPVLNKEIESESLNDTDSPNTLKRKRASEEEEDEDDQDGQESAEQQQQSETDVSVPAKPSSKKTRLDDSSTSQQSRSLLGKCIIL